ncbi:MAG: hypothetical protein EAZ39_30820 [Oscillatoriales cyanobacterium]|nr:MAG: hypothetical protein EAZ39_30820 [Oscillatoriales cyanobacterium]
MLDNDIVDDQSINEDSYDGLVSLIEASKGVLSLLIASCKPGDFQTQMINRYESTRTEFKSCVGATCSGLPRVTRTPHISGNYCNGN